MWTAYSNRDAEGAWESANRCWRHAKRSMTARIDLYRSAILSLRIRAATMMIQRGHVKCSTTARRDLRRLKRTRIDPAHAKYHFAKGILEFAMGNLPVASLDLTRSIELLEKHDMKLYGHVARWQLRQIEGKTRGGHRIESSAEWLSSQGVADPLRFARIFCPDVTTGIGGQRFP